MSSPRPQPASHHSLTSPEEFSVRTDFNDDGADRMQWGERIRKLEANKAAALKTYKKFFREQAYQMFENTTQFGPAWAVCAIQQLKTGLGQLGKILVDEAGNANTIANALGDVYVIDAVTGNKGPSLSAIIEAKASKDLARLDEFVRKWPYYGKRKAVCDAAYQLTCRLARIGAGPKWKNERVVRGPS